MSGLNAIEMSSLTQSRRTYGYRRALPGPDCNESAGAGPPQGHGAGVAGAENAGRGSSVGGPVGPADPTDPAQARGTRRCVAGTWPPRQALQPEVPVGVSPQGAVGLSAAVRWLRSDLRRGETAGTGPGRE